MLKLMRALNRIATADLPIHVSPTMRTYVETIAREAGPAGEPWYGLLEQDSFAATLEALPVRPSMKKMLHSQFHNSLAPTVLSAGSKVNVIPASAECVVDCRIVPGQTRDDVLREVRSLIGDDFDVEFRSAIASTGVEQAGAAHSELWHLMDKGIRKHGDGVVVPFLMTGGTDARFQIKLGTQMFGFTPSLAPIEEYDRIHAHDERVAVSDLEFGVRVLYDVVEEYCAA
ncbi:MAG: M20/M25/M40 family metallo-hydrolase [Chloroflexi bacterium]|nr:MAG: M20/M25/M40 family metallo-hydrolase [Chloroflexota bacterium]